MEKSNLYERTERFSVSIMNMVETLPSGKSMGIISGQILRSAKSVGANYRAARRENSTKDFINKLKIVEDETDETIFWLELMHKSGKVDPGQVSEILKEARQLLAIFVASVKTARLNGGGG